MNRSCKKDASRKKRKRLERIEPHMPLARDEGPRLLPLRSQKDEHVPLNHYLKLADVALESGAKKPHK